jgi:anti-sigma B factor antagonist
MDLSEEKLHGIVILEPAGRLDAGSAATLEEALRRRVDAGDRRFVLDGHRLDYIDSAGLRTILLAAQRLKPAGGEIVLAGLTDYVHEVFAIAGLTSILKVFSSVDEAVGALR